MFSRSGGDFTPPEFKAAFRSRGFVPKKGGRAKDFLLDGLSPEVSSDVYNPSFCHLRVTPSEAKASLIFLV
jgi:hypothetical protein